MYKEANDIFLSYINNKIVKEDSHTTESGDKKENKICLGDIYTDFKDWCAEGSVIRSNIPTKDDLKEDLIVRWGEPCNKGRNKWFGYRFRTTEDNEKED